MISVLSEQGLDLASKLLSLDPEKRPTASEALQHLYFTKELPRPERPTGYVLEDITMLMLGSLGWVENGMSLSQSNEKERRKHKIKNRAKHRQNLNS